MTPESNWLDEKDSLEPNEKLTPIGIVIVDDEEENKSMRNEILKSFTVGELENEHIQETVTRRLENEDERAGQQN